MNKDSKIYVAGHRGMVGSAIVRKLTEEGYQHILEKTSSELDLRDQKSVSEFFNDTKPEYVFLAAAKVGGILANNSQRGEFLYDNLMIQTHVIHAAYKQKVKKLLFLGSSCIYPKLCPQPIKEEYLLTGLLEPTNEPYAIAKIAGIKLCESYHKQYGCNFISAMPTNLYGPNDNYDLQSSHVLPALIRKFHEAVVQGKTEVSIWGSGNPRREFLHVDDLADASLFLMLNYESPEPVNVGTGNDITIRELAELIADISGFQGKLTYDLEKPEGTPRKLLDVTKIKLLGWTSSMDLRVGIKKVYQEFSELHVIN
jgi:GDP-L-fucose synthase